MQELEIDQRPGGALYIYCLPASSSPHLSTCHSHTQEKQLMQELEIDGLLELTPEHAM